jgi:hypothetical protein
MAGERLYDDEPVCQCDQIAETMIIMVSQNSTAKSCRSRLEHASVSDPTILGLTTGVITLSGAGTRVQSIYLATKHNKQQMYCISV